MKTQRNHKKWLLVSGITVAVALLIFFGVRMINIANLCETTNVETTNQEEDAQSDQPTNSSMWIDVHNVDLENLPEIKTLPPDFEKFLNQFTQNRKMQLSLIRTPLFFYTGQAGDPENIEVLISRCELEKFGLSGLYSKVWDYSLHLEESDLQEMGLFFFDKSYFFIGSKTCEERSMVGTYKGEGNFIVYNYYNLYLSENAWLNCYFIFEKINGDWKLIIFKDFRH